MDLHAPLEARSSIEKSGFQACETHKCRSVQQAAAVEGEEEELVSRCGCLAVCWKSCSTANLT